MSGVASVSASPTFATLERELREAFARGHEPELHLQPRLHVASGQCRGAEGLLAELGCDHLQGFHFARAIPLPEFVRWLQDRVGAAPMIAKLPKD